MYITKNIFWILILILEAISFRSVFVSAATLNKNMYQPDEIVVISTGPIGGSNIIIYDLTSMNSIMASGIGDDPLEIQLTMDVFTPGDYIIINTQEPNGCQFLTLKKCRANATFISETTFSVSVNEGLTTPIPALPPKPEVLKESLLVNVLDAFLSLFGKDDALVGTPAIEQEAQNSSSVESASTTESTPTIESVSTIESATKASITAPLDATSTSTVTATIDGEVPETTISTEETSITAPLDDTDTSITTTTF